MASARWGVCFAATVHEPPAVPRCTQNCPIIFEDPKYGVPQRPIDLSALSSCHGVRISVYGTRESANRRSNDRGNVHNVPAPYIWLMHGGGTVAVVR